MEKDTKIFHELRIISRGDKQAETELINLIIKETSNSVTQMYALMQAEDWENVKGLAHKMKSVFVIIKQLRAIELADIIHTDLATTISEKRKHLKEFLLLNMQLINRLKDKKHT